MNVAFLVGDFPVISQTFVSNLIDDVIKKKRANVSVFCSGVFNDDELSDRLPDIKGRISFIFKSPDTRLVKIVRYAVLFLGAAFRNPRHVYCLVKMGLGIRVIAKSYAVGRFMDKARIDLIHAQFLSQAIYAVIARRFFMKNKVVIMSSIRGYDIARNDVISSVEHAMVLDKHFGVDQYLCVSESLVDEALRRGIEKNRIWVLRSGLKVGDFRYRAPRSNVDGKISFIQVGRLVEKKGFALSLLALSRICFPFNLRVVGSGPDRDRLERLVDDLGIGSSVEFLGARSHKEVISDIAEADIMLVPSVRSLDGDCEGIPNVAKEAMLLGVICVTSDHSGLPEVIKDGNTGYIFPENDLEGFCKAIDKAIKDVSSWSVVSMAARELVESNFCSDHIADEALDFYDTQFRLM